MYYIKDFFSLYWYYNLSVHSYTEYYSDVWPFDFQSIQLLLIHLQHEFDNEIKSIDYWGGEVLSGPWVAKVLY